MSHAPELNLLSATELASALRQGQVTAQEVVSDCLASIETLEPTVQAWASLDAEHALDQARRADARRAAGETLGPLHGLPVGIKDVIDTADMPTECGSALYSGRTPRRDATLVARLRAAGAIVMGKTVTTEFAFLAPGKTRNPHDPNRTPGGSSSGSAAAVSAAMVPLAIGTQTNGSVIRPASFCGVYAFKPSHGMISRQGVFRLSRALDQVGTFARTISDLALLTEALIAYDPEDRDTRMRPPPPLVASSSSLPPVPPKLAFVRSPAWPHAEEETRAAFAELVDTLGDRIDTVELPPAFDEAASIHRTIMEAEMAFNMAGHYERSSAGLSVQMREIIERGQQHHAVEYQRALAAVPRLTAELDDLFAAYDAIITPSAPGVAPPSLETTGNPIFCTLWTLCGVPALNLPMMQAGSGMPIGVQLVGAKGDDARLMRIANWLTALPDVAGD